MEFIDRAMSDTLKAANLERHLLNFLYDPFKAGFRQVIPLQALMNAFDEVLNTSVSRDIMYGVIVNNFKAKIYSKVEEI